MNSNNTSQSDRDDSSQNSSIDRTFINEALDRQREIIFEEFSHIFGSNLKSASQRDNFDFKNEGLKKQFNFNNDRLEKLSELEALFDYGNLETFKSVLAKEKQEIKDRNKILKIADSHGWDTVREYSADPLADNNEDASKLRSAINRARYARKFKPYDFKNKGLIQAQLWEQHLPGSQLVSSFFPNLKRDLERLCNQHRPGILGETHNRISSTRSPSASHVISDDILPTNALLDTDNLCQLSKSSGTDSLLQLSNLQPKMHFNNKVEYSFSVKNSDTFKSVNGRLVKCVEFWTNE